MSARPNKRSDPGTSETGWVILVAVILGVAVLAGPAYAGWRAGGGSWGATAIAVAAALYVVLFALVALGVVMVMRYRRGREWTDSLAGSMSTRRDLVPMSEKTVLADTRRLGAQDVGNGVRIGRAVLNKQWLLSTYEWTQLWIMGTRAGKTTTAVVPQLVEHRGPALATSNKRDVRDLSYGPRSELGKVWTLDMQRITGGGPTWWWNPLSFITAGLPLGQATDRATTLVELFIAAVSDHETRASNYFDKRARAWLSDLMLAAALAGEPITRVFDWLAAPDGKPGLIDPAQILSEHRYPVIATEVTSFVDLTPKQRDGLTDTAQGFIEFLRSPSLVDWITPRDEHDTRTQFDPRHFASSTDTMYLLSKEGAGSGGAIVAALTVAICTAAEEYATTLPGGRLARPLLCLLDEAANICRWPALPGLYSHYGSRGILLVTILQSRAQGEIVWGKDGMRAMASAANIFVIGRGLNDRTDLEDLAALIGDRQIAARSRSIGTRGNRSTSTQIREERILSVADLRALPQGRAVMLASGTRPVLLQLVHWSDREHAAQIAASQDYYGNPANDDLSVTARARATSAKDSW